jgi:hypothetical protein
MDKVMPDEFRPDRCGVMIELPFESNCMIAHVNPDKPDALKNKWLGVIFQKLGKAGYPVIFPKDKGYDSSKLH